ncbi:MAG: flagellar filament capping protein FliD, partial [Fretibacterium sp.]|nr:flagellar filament capping protein FliD [Fretibacterium sp.]
MADMTVSGIVSGMDWEGMITQLVEKAQKPAQVQMNKRTNLTNKKALFEEMQELTEKMQSSLTSLRLTSTYEAKKVDVDRLDSNASAKGVLTAKVNADAVAGVYNIEVKQLAKAQTIRSNQLTSQLGTGALGGAETSTLWISNMGQKVGIEVNATDTLTALASRINNTIKTLDTPLNLTASVVDNRLIFKSDNTGLPESTSTETVTYKTGQNTALNTITVSQDTLKDGDVVITDTSGNKWTNGKDFDIVQGADGNEVRWRTSEANTVPPTYSYTATYTAAVGDTYTSSSITRGSGSVDSKVLGFTPSENTDASRLVITDEDGFTYSYGTDFTFSGTSIKWLSTGDAPNAGTAYTVSYTAGGTVYADTTTHTRGETAAERVLNLTDSSGKTLSYSDVSANLNERSFSVVDQDGVSYTYGTDFTITNSGGKPQIAWVSTSVGPASGKSFSVTYTEPGNETFNVGMTRGDTDAVKDVNGNELRYFNLVSSGDTVTITKSDGTTLYNGVDFTLTQDEDRNAVIKWNASAAWAMPDPGDEYTLNIAHSDGTTSTFTETRTKGDSVDLEAAGFTAHNGSITDVTYTETGEDGTETTIHLQDSSDQYVEIDGATINWLPRDAGEAITPPGNNASLTVSYTYSDTSFSLDDGGSGLLANLGLDKTDEEHYTAAQDAIVYIDGDEVTISANYIEYDNDILNGVRLDFKGVGEVSLDVSQDTDKTVETIETFVESYNTLMDWINTRSSEKQVNTNYSETDNNVYLSHNSDDFHTSWGLLYGNSYLRNTKSALRSIISQNYSFTFKERTSSEPVYGDMAYNGIKRTTLNNGTQIDGSATLRIKVGDHAANITITSSDTLETIADKINDATD